VDKKGNAFLILMLVFTALILSLAFYLAYSKMTSFKGYVGKSQAELVFFYQEGERQLMYTDLAAKYAMQDSLIESLSRVDGCGKYMDSPTVFSTGQCNLSMFMLQRTLARIFNRKVNLYFDFSQYSIPKSNYLVSIPKENDTIKGFAAENIYLPSYNKEKILAGMTKQERECITNNQIPNTMFGVTACSTCSGTDCSDYDENSCKLDPCKLSCSWTDQKCTKAITFYSINPSFTISNSFNISNYFNISLEVSKIAKECSQVQDKPGCFISKAKNLGRVAVCLDAEEEKFFRLYESMRSCQESQDNNCRCSISYNGNNKVSLKVEAGSIILEDSNFSEKIDIGQTGMLYEQAGTFYIKDLKNAEIDINNGISIKGLQEVYDKEMFRNNGIFFVDKQTAAGSIYQSTPFCKIKYDKAQVCIESKQKIFSYTELKSKPAIYRFSVAFEKP
jgi:hypothetical protein